MNMAPLKPSEPQTLGPSNPWNLGPYSLLILIRKVFHGCLFQLFAA